MAGSWYYFMMRLDDAKPQREKSVYRFIVAQCCLDKKDTRRLIRRCTFACKSVVLKQRNLLHTLRFLQVC